NAALLKFVAYVVPGFVIESFEAAFFGALLISFISWLLNIFVGGTGKVVVIRRLKRGGDGGPRND
ncbi:MAG TPA: phage holin family protein, partial [Nitrospirota bacterium]|nr:phage holin family protein [Nitrospirota bacterium]